MESPLKVDICSQALGAPPSALKQQLAALESKYESLALENARLANENMMMHSAQLTQKTLLLRMRSQNFADPMMAAHQWWGPMAPWAMPPQVGHEQQFSAELRSQLECAPRKGVGKKSNSDGQAAPFTHCDAESTSGYTHTRTTSAGSKTPSETDNEQSEPNLLTTVMMRNIPINMTREMLLQLMNAEGFVGSYDFVYLPMDFKKMVGLGYSFINLVDGLAARRFHAHFSGFDRWGIQTEKVCEMAWSDALQGKDAHIERYRNSPVMHHSMPDDCKPLLFDDGERQPFPEPTKRIRAPRQWPQRG